MFNPRNLFNKEEFSDLTVRIGNVDFKCHKVVLGSTSRYFAGLIKDAAIPADGTNPVIHLDDEPLHCSDAILRWIYTSSYTVGPGFTSWRYELGIARLANKYGLVQLEAIALEAFKRLVRDENGIDRVADILEELNGAARAEFTDRNLQDVVHHLEIKHMPELLCDPQYALLQDDKEQMKDCLQRMRRYWFTRCNICGECDVVEHRDADEYCCGCDEEKHYERCWFQGREAQDVQDEEGVEDEDDDADVDEGVSSGLSGHTEPSKGRAEFFANMILSGP